jgi:hypothetical protein
VEGTGSGSCQRRCTQPSAASQRGANGSTQQAVFGQLHDSVRSAENAASTVAVKDAEESGRGLL